MPLFAVLIEDDPALAGEVRRRHMADHLERFARQSGA
jgi:hypothetical protein